MSDLDDLLDRHAPGGDHPLVVGVRRDAAATVWSRGRLPDGAASLFEIGSVTKTFTGLLLALLAADGTVGLDDELGAHLPTTPPVVGRPLTLLDLATHHSGLPRLPAGALWPGVTTRRHDPYAHLDEPRLLDAVARTRPRRPPGVKFAYSNLGAGLLGLALARAAGTTYERLLAERVTGPLGLADTGVHVPGEDHRLAPGHGVLGRPAGRWDLAALAGAGGLLSTATDLLRYLALHDPAARGPLAAAAAETARPRHEVGRAASVGLGWLRVEAGQGPVPGARLPHDLLFHDGGTGGYRSFAAVLPQTGAAVVVLSGRARGVTGLGLRLVRALD